MSMGRPHPDRAAVDDGGNAVADALVDALHQARRGREVRIVEIQDDGIALRDLRRHRALDRGAVRECGRSSAR